MGTTAAHVKGLGFRVQDMSYSLNSAIFGDPSACSPKKLPNRHRSQGPRCSALMSSIRNLGSCYGIL